VLKDKKRKKMMLLKIAEFFNEFMIQNDMVVIAIKEE